MSSFANAMRPMRRISVGELAKVHEQNLHLSCLLPRQFHDGIEHRIEI